MRGTRSEASSDGMPAARLGPYAVLAAAVLWGTTGTAQALADTALHPVVVGWSRLVIGGVALLVVARAGRAASVRNSMAALLSPERRYWLLVAALATATFQATFFAGVARSGVALGTMIAIGSSPVITGLLGRLLLREPLSRGWWAATVVAIAGCALILNPSAGASAVDPLGVGLSFVAGAGYALFAVTIRRVLAGDIPFLLGPAAALSLGGLFLAPLAVMLLLSTGGIAQLVDSKTLIALAWLGLAASAGAYGFFGWGIQRVSAAAAGSLTLAEPLVAFSLGVAVLGEQPSALSIAGSALVVGALAFLALVPKRRAVPSIAS